MKVSKREFVKGAAAVALALSARGSAVAAANAGAPASRPGSFDVVVYNDWFPQAHEFAASFPEARALPVGGDAGRLWYGRLRGLVDNGLRRIAGLTTHTDLLILETLARDAGLRVRSRRESGRLVSWVLI
jgi:hypothetical protein